MTGTSLTAVVRARTPSSPQRRFGTFEGVFTPTLLTILGVIMFLREGWVAGQLGLLGAWLVVLLASVITSCTALSPDEQELEFVQTMVDLAGSACLFVRDSGDEDALA